MYQKILVPLDGSAYSERILAHLSAFVTPGVTELILLRVVQDYPAYPLVTNGEAVALINAGNGRDEAEQYLRILRNKLCARGFRAHIRVMEGDVVSCIRMVAVDEAVELVAMTTHGRSGISRWALGSVADHVLRVVEQPVLLMRGDTPVLSPSTERTVLVPLDGSIFAEQVLRQAERLTQGEPTTFLLLRALDLSVEKEVDGMLINTDGNGVLRAMRTRAVLRYLTEVETELHKRGIAARSLVHDLPPAQAILQTAQEEAASLIMMSTHARHGLGRWVYGSVADAVLRGAPCPVLLSHVLSDEVLDSYPFAGLASLPAESAP